MLSMHEFLGSIPVPPSKREREKGNYKQRVQGMGSTVSHSKKERNVERVLRVNAEATLGSDSWKKERKLVKTSWKFIFKNKKLHPNENMRQLAQVIDNSGKYTKSPPGAALKTSLCFGTDLP